MANKRYQVGRVLVGSVSVITVSVIALLPLLLLSSDARAADECIDKTCIDVFTEDNQLIITAQKGGASKKASSKPVPKKVVIKKVTPTPKPTFKPTLKPTFKPSPKPTLRPVIKSSAKPKVKLPAASASLSDRLVKLLPLGDINFQPETDALVNLPVYFWTSTPQRFQAVIPILDLLVYVNLYSTFTWSFADSTFKTTTNQGGPFPIGLITHTYRKNGDYPVQLQVIWRGTWSVNGVTTPISGNAITQSISRRLSVVDARGIFTK